MSDAREDGKAEDVPPGFHITNRIEPPEVVMKAAWNQGAIAFWQGVEVTE